MKLLSSLARLSLILWLSGCTAGRVHTDMLPSTNLSQNQPFKFAEAMEKAAKVTAIFEFMGKRGLVASVPAMPGIPYLAGSGLAEVRQRLEGQLQTYFVANCFARSSYRLEILVLLPLGNQVNPSSFVLVGKRWKYRDAWSDEVAPVIYGTNVFDLSN